MGIAGVMIAHQVAAKAVRDAAFLGAWPSTALPAMVIATAILVVISVPVYSRLLGRFGPGLIVPAGFLLSALAHVLEWRLLSGHPWVAVWIYLHVAGLGALLLSGFWSLISELFEPQTAKAAYGRIAAVGTLGGLLGGLSAERIAAMLPQDSVLLFLSALHVMCAAAMRFLARRSATTPFPPRQAAATSRLFEFDALRPSPHLKILAVMVVLSTTGAAIIDYLFKSGAKIQFSTNEELLRFFAFFYAGVQIVTFLVQTRVGQAVRKLGLGRTISSLPAGFGTASIVAFLFQSFPVFAVVRGVEAVLRGSFFRSGYELLFVPMDPVEKHRTKTFLDVTCDRAGDAIGAGIVQVLLLTGTAALPTQLLAFVIGLSALGIWLGRRLDVLYLGVVERSLVQHAEQAPLVVGSETGWSIVEIRPPLRASRSSTIVAVPQPPRREDDWRLRSLADLRSGDRKRVDEALGRLTNPDALQVVQIIRLLAWDDMVTGARRVLEQVASSHIGLLVDELLNQNTDFAIRRRIPRILGTLSSERALDGLVRGLDDSRFEVRYQCGRAIDRMLRKNEGLSVDHSRILNVIERELSVSPQVWQGHRLIDRVERDDEAIVAESRSDRPQQNLEHVFSLLAAVLPREALQVAYHGISADTPGLRALALEYLDRVLPPAIRSRLEVLLETPIAEK